MAYRFQRLLECLFFPSQQDHMTAFSYILWFFGFFQINFVLSVFGTTRLFWTLFKTAIVHKINIYPKLNLGFVINNLIRKHFNKISKFYVILIIKIQTTFKFWHVLKWSLLCTIGIGGIANNHNLLSINPSRCPLQSNNSPSKNRREVLYSTLLLKKERNEKYSHV